MEIQLVETLKIIVERYNREQAQGSIFILLDEFPWHNEPNGQLIKLFHEGMIAKPKFYSNGALITLTSAGRLYFAEKHWIIFPQKNDVFPCPVCGYQAKILSTDAARMWAEISCENCSTFAIRANALEDIPSIDMPFLSGYYRHAYHEPMIVQCDDRETVKSHIDKTRKMVTRDYQMRMLLSYYYQKVDKYGQFVSFDCFPAIAFTRDESDLKKLLNEGQKLGYLEFHDDMISICKEGKRFLDSNNDNKKKTRPTVFISYNWGCDSVADELQTRLSLYADVIRDKTSLKPWGDLLKFMSSIRDQDLAVLIISDEYLKSDACLFEVMELMKEQQWTEKVMFIVVDNAHRIYDVSDQLNYIEYWEKKEKKLKEEIQKHNPAAVAEQAKELNRVSFIALNIGSFMAKVKSTCNPEMNESIEGIVKRVIELGVKKSEALQEPQDETGEMINSESRLLHSFFEAAVKYDIEEFINRSAVEGFPFEMVNNEEPFIYSIQILLFHSPMLCASEIYCGIEKFLKSFIEYTDFLPCVTEVLYNRIILATNRYHTIEEKKDIQHMENLRNNTVECYNSLKLLQKN